MSSKNQMNVEQALLLLDSLFDGNTNPIEHEQIEPIISFDNPVDSNINEGKYENLELFDNVETFEETTDENDTDPDYHTSDDLLSDSDSELTEARDSDGAAINVIQNEQGNQGNGSGDGQQIVHEMYDGVDDEGDENIDDQIRDEGSKRSRKRQRNPEQWKQNIRKRRRQAGQEYTNTKGERQLGRKVKNRKDCEGKCKFQCSRNITADERHDVFSEFWSLTDTEKHTFYAKTTERTEKERTRTKSQTSRKRFSFKYFVVKKGERVRVCKEFYLGTLDISQRRVEWFHTKKMNENKYSDKRGKHPKRTVPEHIRKSIKSHIDSFPRMPSHYCRAQTRKEYLEANLSLAKMYNLYVEKCTQENAVPAKLHFYRLVFNSEYNIEFFVPKKDRCDTCMEFEAAQQAKANTTQQENNKYKQHLQDKDETRKERDRDRKNATTCIVCFDMQNVITCPRANVSSFFYKRKLNVYNLTAHCSLNKKAYNAIWAETTAGRGGNEICSALLVILKAILADKPDTESFVLWSDSCVPQNRNAMMTFGLKKFMSDNPTIKSISQKYCTPGHSSIQEVDNIHSHIEKALRLTEIYSPVSLLRIMTQIRPRNSKVIQLKDTDFLNFRQASISLKFSGIPYTKVKHLSYSSNKPFHVQYKTSFTDNGFTETPLQRQTTRNKSKRVENISTVIFTQTKALRHTPGISKEKSQTWLIWSSSCHSRTESFLKLCSRE